MYDAAIIGLGGVGSFCLRNLARRAGKNGGKFIGIERFSLNHAKGSSHGKTRIYRRAYFEHESYVPWIEHSISRFRELEDESGASLMNQCGLLTVAPSSATVAVPSPASSPGLPPLLEATRKAADLHNIPIESLANGDLKERYPQLRYKDDMIGILEPTAGFLRPERILEAVHRDIASFAGDDSERSSVTVMERTQVTSIQLIKDGTSEHALLRIKNDEGEEHEIATRCALISAGSWASQLLPPSWSKHLRVTRQIQSWIDVSGMEDLAAYGPESMPVWFMETPDWHIPVFGLPFDPDAGGRREERLWIKVGMHGRDDPLSDPSANPSVVSSGEESELRHVATVALTAFAGSSNGYGSPPQLAETQPCMYTMTPDGHYLIGSPSKCMFAVAGLSGHGFKMVPALGEMMADYALGEGDCSSKWNLDFYSPERFGS